MCMWVWVLAESEEDTEFPGAGVTAGCEQPDNRCWELTSGPMEAQWVLLTAELSLESLHKHFLKKRREDSQQVYEKLLKNH